MISAEVLWTVVVILVVPAAVLAVSELDERLRQAESPFRPAVSTIRTWTLPLFGLWAIVVPVLDVDRTTLLVRAVASGLLVSVAIAVLQLLRIVVGRVRHRPREDGRGPVPQLVLALPRIAVLLVAGWVLLAGVWDVDLSAALTALGVTSLVVSFALQDTLSGLASGFLLLSDQPFQPGDWVEVDDTEGVVVDLNWRTTRIRTRSGYLIVVPNSQLANANIVNHSAPGPLHKVIYPVQVAFVNPPTTAKNMLLDAARATPNVLADPPPEVRVVQTDDPLMGYEIHVWIDDYALVPQIKSDLGSLVWYQSERQGVPLPSPAQDLFLHDTSGGSEPPDPMSLRADLLTSPLFAMLGDDDVDQLVAGARRARFSAGEQMIEGDTDRRDLLVVVEGRCLLVLVGGPDDEIVIGDVAVGDTVGVLEGSRLHGRLLTVRAVTDCEVLILDGAVSGEIASRNAELAAALNRLSSIRSRRADRLMAKRATPATEHTHDDAGLP